jgi:hypothetical protein
MSHATDPAASRFGRDRDVFSDAPRMGPYETPYDVRRGYQQPLGRPARRHERGEGTVLFLARDDDGEQPGR